LGNKRHGRPHTHPEETWYPQLAGNPRPAASLRRAVASIVIAGIIRAGGASTKNVGKTPGLENNIFDNTGAHDAAMFHRSLKQITE